MRSLSAGLITAFDAAHATIVAFVRFEFDSGVSRYTTAGHDITWDGFTWLGVGSLAAIEEVAENVELEFPGTRITLSGVPSAILSLALAEPAQGRIATIFFGAIDPTTRAIVTAPAVEYIGLMDTMPIEDGAQEGSVTVNCESRMVVFATPRTRRFTDPDQRKRSATDGFFRFTAQMVDRELVWPAKEFGR
jgi:hypothetical protein